jgi:hypothetical protein
MCVQKPIDNYLLLTIALNSTTNTYNLPDDGTLRDAKRITGFRPMYAFNAGMTDPSGNALCDAATFKTGYLSIKKKGTNVPIQQMPLNELALIPSTNGNTQPVVPINVTDINPSGCYVQFGDVSAVTAGDVLLIGVYFEA